jgi:hypothetical protein
VWAGFGNSIEGSGEDGVGDYVSPFVVEIGVFGGGIDIQVPDYFFPLSSLDEHGERDGFESTML